MSECKHEGCLEPAVDRMGRYAGLCEFHREQRKHDQAQAQGEPETIGDLVAAASRFLDAARALAEAKHEYDAALEAVRRKP